MNLGEAQNILRQINAIFKGKSKTCLILCRKVFTFKKNDHIQPMLIAKNEFYFTTIS